MISHLLKELPADNFYRVLLARRDLREVVASQDRMLEREGRPARTDPDAVLASYESHLVNVKVLIKTRSNFDLLEVAFDRLLHEPADGAERMNRFVGGHLDTSRMTGVIDPSLYRTRSSAE